MNKNLFPVLFGFVLIIGCQNRETKEETQPNKQTILTAEASKELNSDFHYPNLLSVDEESYSLLVIGEPDETNPIEEDKNMMRHSVEILSLPTLEMAKKAYPKLAIKNEPAYFLFDYQGLIFQSNNLNEMNSFLNKIDAK